MSASDFAGFSKELPAFLAELRANNERDWFELNRERYEAVCLRPCLDFIEAVASTVEAFDPPHKAVAKVDGSLRRIFRDTRFSKDKTPYHTFLHLIFWTGAHPNRSPGLHLVLSPGGFGIGAGQWALTPEELTRYRAAVQKEGRLGELRTALAAAKEAGCHLEKPELKRVPKGLVATPGNEDLLRQKGIVVRNRNEEYPEGFFDRRCADVILARFEKLLPLQKWLAENVSAAS